ncbi:MAG TPA: thioredoxin [Acidimicrobiia bacterium]|jgi:thioredoxin 1|nr:thioredoxin [Acidimicrobiia bacterium]
MPTQEITKDTFNDTINNNDIVLMDWWASWCGPCRSFAPVFEEAAERHGDIVFGKIDTEAQPELSAMARITSIPTLMAFRDGILIFSQPGALPSASLEELIGKVRELDMEQVHAALAAEEQSG